MKGWIPIGVVAVVGFSLAGWQMSEVIGQRPPPAQASGEKVIEGRVQQFTTAPLGEKDGAVLEDGTILHWPPHLQRQFSGILRLGDRVQATGQMETGPAGDSHFEVQRLRNLRTKVSSDTGSAAQPPVPPGPIPGRPPAPGPTRLGKANPQTVQGRVQSFTTAPRGEVDGAQLDNGTLLHWPPHMGASIQGVIGEDDLIRATGRMETGPAGDTHFEIQSITNLDNNSRVNVR